MTEGMQPPMRRLVRWLGRERPNPVASVALALACVLASTLLRLALDPIVGTGYSFVTYFLAVTLAGALAGFVGAGTALAGSALVAWYLFVPPAHSFALAPRDALALVIFVVNAGLSGAAAAALRRTLAALSRAEDRQQLLINELNHRVKNTLATVQSLALQTARGSPSYEEYQVRFAERLAALSAAHDLLTRHNWEGAELGALLDEVLKPYRAPQITAEGPEVSLSPNAAVTTSLALHELATNAAKHGALARESGRVDVSWGYEGEELAFEWRESGVHGLEPPTRQGFGARLLKAAARELDARVESEFAADGLAYRWRVPLSRQVRRAPV